MTKTYLDGLRDAKAICKSYVASLIAQDGPAKITVACANNIIDFLCDDIEAREIAYCQDNGISNTVPVFSMDLGATDLEAPLPSNLGSTKCGKAQSLGSIESARGRFKKGRP